MDRLQPVIAGQLGPAKLRLDVGLRVDRSFFLMDVIGLGLDVRIEDCSR